MNLLQGIPIVRQRHPGLGLQQPFDMICDYHYGADRGYHGDMHYALQFGIVLHGSVEVIFNDFKREYSEGEAWWIMFWEPHAFRFTGRRNFILTFNIDIDHLGNCDPFNTDNWLLPFVTAPALRYCPSSTADKEFFKGNGRNLFRYWTKRPKNWKLHSWLLIHELILRANDNMVDSQSAAPHIESAARFMKIKPAVSLAKNSTGRPPSLEEGATACNLSVSRFSELFRQTIGISFSKFAARARLAAAARELKSRNHAIEEIAADLGFYDSSHFNHAFRELYGCSPKQYQNSD